MFINYMLLLISWFLIGSIIQIIFHGKYFFGLYKRAVECGLKYKDIKVKVEDFNMNPHWSLVIITSLTWPLLLIFMISLFVLRKHF